MNPRYWELVCGGRPTVEEMLAKIKERDDAVTGTLLARIDPEIARLVVNLKAVSQMAGRYLSELAESFENEKATSTHLEEINVALVRQAILTVLDEANPCTPGLAWNFDDDAQRVDFADRVATFLPSAPSATYTCSQDADFVRIILKTLRENPYPTLGGTATWQSIEVWAEDFLRRVDSTVKEQK